MVPYCDQFAGSPQIDDLKRLVFGHRLDVMLCGTVFQDDRVEHRPMDTKVRLNCLSPGMSAQPACHGAEAAAASP
jgi:hypothetical protein